MQDRIIMRAVLLLFLGHTIALSTAKCQSIMVQQVTQLTGTVMDSSESRIANAKLTIKGQGQTRIVTTADDGTYKVALLPGLYRVRVTNPGFCPMTRAPFKVKSSSNITINFIMFDCALEYALTMENGQFTNAVDRYRLPFKEESFFVGSMSSQPLDVLVQFGEKQEGRDNIQYKGFKLSGDRQVGVTVSYDLLTIHADNVCLNKTTFQLEAKGNVIVENGSSHVSAAQVSVELKSGQMRVKKLQ